MTHRIIEIKVVSKYTISAIFQNGVEKEYDMRQLFSAIPQFDILKTQQGLFEQVRVDVGGYGISWNDELDLSAEELWENGIATGKVPELNIKLLVGEKLTSARELAGMTQAELSVTTGLYQADISKIERGMANPSLQTLKRLADGLGMNLNIEFIQK